MKKISLLILSLVLFTLVGCKDDDFHTPGIQKENFKTVCLDGVTYYMFCDGQGYVGYGYMSVKLDRNSKIVPCSN